MTETHFPNLLEVRDLSIGLPEPNAQVLVEKIRFSLHAGETLGIVGASGSGKTLTACALSALLPGDIRVLTGSIRYQGRNLNLSHPKKPGFRRGHDILMLFQSPSGALNPSSPVGVQIAEIIPRTGHERRGAVFERAVGLMEMVGLEDTCFYQYPFQLSGGQRQRVLLAMAFGLEPRILIADEPTAGLDEKNRDMILNLLIKLQSETDSAAIIISHDLRVISRIAGHVMVLYQGKQVESGNVSEVLKHPMHPHTCELVEAMHYLEKQS